MHDDDKPEARARAPREGRPGPGGDHGARHLRAPDPAHGAGAGSPDGAARRGTASSPTTLSAGCASWSGWACCIAAATRSGRLARRSASTTCSSTATRPNGRTDSHPSGFSEAEAQATGRMRRRSIMSGFAPCLGLREAAGERLYGNVSPGVGAPPHGGLTSCPGSREGAAADPRQGGQFASSLTSRGRKTSIGPASRPGRQRRFRP